MDEERKKRNNRKKKNKAAKTSQDIDISADAHHTTNPNQHSHISHNTNQTQDIILPEAEKEKWIQREAALEETIEQLRTENNFRLEKEDTLQDTIKQLEEKNNAYIQREGSLLEAIQHLETERKSLVFNEHTIKETLSILDDEATFLRAQVVELEESRQNLIHENKRLMESSSELQSQIQILTQTTSSTISSDEVTKELNSELATAYAVVEKLTTENAALRDKVNELNVDLNQRSNVPSSALKMDQIMGSASSFSSSNLKLESAEITPTSSPKSMALGSVPMKSEKNDNANLDPQNNYMAPTLSASDAAEEIVHVPLEELEAGNVELQQAAEDDDKESVSISDAPLIGAPFRLVSFLARYVSGADLVDQSTFR